MKYIKELINVNKFNGSCKSLIFALLFIFSSNYVNGSLNLSNKYLNDSCKLSLDSVSNITCFGSDDGSITVQVDSGAGMYHYYLEMYNSTYPLNNGWQSVGQVPAPGQYTSISNVTFTNLPSDTFRVVLDDSANQCFDTIGFPITNIILSEPSQIFINETILNATNVLSLDGSVLLNVSGGVPNYSFSWTGPNNFISNSQNISGLSIGTYIYNILDANGCLIIDSVEIIPLQACSFGVYTSVPPICYGDPNGEIIVNSVFGTPQYQYTLQLQDSITLNWNNALSVTVADTFYTFSNLYGGIYRYILSDDSGCLDTSSLINVQNPTMIYSNSTVIAAGDSISCDGEINTVISGGVAPFSHYWTGPNSFTSNSSSIFNLCPGNYCDSVVDASGCVYSFCELVEVEPPCSPEIDISNIFCDDDSSGIAIVSKAANNYPLFTWTNIVGDTLSMDTFAINLPAGDYTFSAYNLGVLGACPDTSISFSILATEITLLPALGNVLCPGDSTLFLVDPVNVDSNSSYQIVIGNDSFMLDDTSLYYPIGIYNYIVEIDTGSGFLPCFINQNIEIYSNDLSIDSFEVVNEICVSSRGEISVFASSSYLPIEYALDTVFQNLSTFTDVSSGYYVVNVRDNMSCVVSDSIFVDLESLISAEVDVFLETCREDDGIIRVLLDGGFGAYQYSIDSGLNYSSPILSDTLIIDSLSSGNYNLVIIDDSLCVLNYGDVIIEKTQDPQIDSVVTVNESCCGNDGMLSVYVTPSSLSNIYSLDTLFNFQGHNTFDSLFRGEYLVYVMDTNECVDSFEIYLNVDSIPNINLTVGITDVVCNGDSNGTFKVYYPNNCYEYDLYRYTLTTPQILIDSGDYFNNLISGYYGIVATSNSGTCIDSSSVKFIDEPQAIVYDSPAVLDVRCLNNDSCNGSVFLPQLPTGGVSPYYYYLKDFSNNIPIGILQALDTFLSLCPSEYQVQVIDANACVSYDTIVIADSSLYIDSFSVQSISCYNGVDGIIEVFVSGGVGSYEYAWSNNDILSFTDSLAKGEYFVSVIDSVGCIALDSVFISHPDTLIFKILENGKKPETCMGVTNDGEIYLEITGGTPPYNYMWNSFSSNSNNSGFGFGDTIFNLTYDTIMIDVTDVNFCSSSPAWGTVNVTIVDALNADNPLEFDSIYTSSYPICYGSYSGYINIDMNGGDDPIYYSIDSANTFSLTDSFPNIEAGKYFIYVMDAYGCLDSAIVNILEYDELIVNYDSIKHVSCYDGSDGFISLTVSGGVSPYSYFWIPTFEITSSIDSLTAIPHVVRITDSSGCVLVDTIDLYELTNPIQIEVDFVSQVSCFNGDDGVLSVSSIGGMPSYNYYWINDVQDTVSTDYIANNLSAGPYVIFVSDQYNCGPASDTIFMTENSQIEIDVISIVDNVCFGYREGTMTFSVSGGLPSYTTNVMDQNGLLTSTSSLTVDGLLSSDYSVWVQDGLNCISDTLVNVKLGEPGKINIDAVVSELSCFESEDGILNIELLGGTSPYHLRFEDNLGLIDERFNVLQSTAQIIDNLTSSEYYVIINDFNNCEADSVFYISQPNEIVADFISVSNFGREDFYFNPENTSIGGDLFYWDFDNGSFLSSSFLENVEITFKDQGRYNVMLVAHDSSLGHVCNDTIIKIVDVEGYDVFNVFSPNNDGVNDVFHFNEWMINGIYVEIFNRWGDKIYHWDDINSGWNGKMYNGRDADEGVYFYRMEATGVDGSHFEENGSITLLR